MTDKMENNENKNVFTIQEVANILDITTQAVYKRLQQDAETLDPYVTSVQNKKALYKDGIVELAKLMNIDINFEKEDNEEDVNFELKDKEDAIEVEADDPQEQLLEYLKKDNALLREEISRLQKELSQTRALREEDKQNALEERKEYEESRKRSDTILMKAMIDREKALKPKPTFFERLFGKKDKDKEKEDKNNEIDKSVFE